jgi:hypothetical protein
MKPHITRSHGRWVIYFQGAPYYRATRFRNIVTFMDTLGRDHFPLLDKLEKMRSKN